MKLENLTEHLVLINLIASIADTMRQQPIIDRLLMEVVSHLAEHALPASH